MTKFRLRSQAGFSLVESLIALAIVGICVSGIVALYAYTRDKFTENEALREIEGLRVQIQDILSQPDLCTYAIRDANNNYLRWDLKNSPTVSVPTLWYTRLNKNPTKLFTPPQSYSRLLTITNMYLREPVTYEGGKARSAWTWADKPVTLVSTKFIVVGQAGRTLPFQRSADVVLMLDSSQRILRCFSGDNITPVANGNAFTCSPTTVNGTTCDTSDAYCKQIYYIDGFLATGAPRCSCMISCFAGPQGASTNNGASSDNTAGNGDPSWSHVGGEGCTGCGNNGSGDTTGGLGGDSGSSGGDSGGDGD